MALHWLMFYKLWVMIICGYQIKKSRQILEKEMEQKTWKCILYREGKNHVATPVILALKGDMGGLLWVWGHWGHCIVFPQVTRTT